MYIYTNSERADIPDAGILTCKIAARRVAVASIPVCAYTYIYIYIYMYLYIYMYIYIYIYTYILTYMCIYIYIYIRIHTHVGGRMKEIAPALWLLGPEPVPLSG